jgi:hypothetical protein
MCSILYVFLKFVQSWNLIVYPCSNTFTVDEQRVLRLCLIMFKLKFKVWRKALIVNVHLISRKELHFVKFGIYTAMEENNFSSYWKRMLIIQAFCQNFRQIISTHMNMNFVLIHTHLHVYKYLISTVNLYLSFPDNSFSWIRRSISMVPERILFQLWLPHLLFSRIHCLFCRPPTKTMNRGFIVISLKCLIKIFLQNKTL